MTDFFDRQEWLARGRELVAAHNGSHWRLGDWCNENPYRNPDSKDDRCEYSKLADEVGIARTTLWTVAWVARHVPTSIRIDALSFTHHRLIAALPETDQRYWLARADKECLSVGALRKALKTPAAPADPEQSAETPAPTDPVKERREELERQVRWLADQRGWNPDVVMSDALAAYLAQPAVADEIKRLRQAEFTRKWESNGLRQWWRQVGDRIDALVGEMCEGEATDRLRVHMVGRKAYNRFSSFLGKGMQGCWRPEAHLPRFAALDREEHAPEGTGGDGRYEDHRASDENGLRWIRCGRRSGLAGGGQKVVNESCTNSSTGPRYSTQVADNT